MRVSRRHLALGAALASFMFIGSHDVAATAATVEVDVATSSQVSQSLNVATNVAGPETDRDGVTVVTYTPIMWPLDPNTRISSYFGLRNCAGCSRDHQGVDYNPGAGHPIVSIADGTVVATGNPSGALGVHAIVEHEVDGQLVRSVYGHMATGTMNLVVGQQVSRGQILGLVGSTGMSTGPHLHFGILINNVAVEPLAWMRAHVTEEW
ncbi:MAG: M23 family metallopeptidase [Aeromicrobium sp.]